MSATLAGKTVLVVEDDPEMRAILCTLLQHYGFSVWEAGDGEKGVQYARERHPDVVLLDLHLPRLSGWEVMEQLRRDAAMAHTRVIAITADGRPESVARARAAGFASFIRKPIEPRNIIREIRSLLVQASPPEPEGGR